MKKLLILAAILLFIGMGYFIYQKWGKNSNLTKWSFVPSDAALVIETEIINDISTLKGFPVWNMVSQSTGFSNLKNGLNFLDSINGLGGFTAIFKDAPLLVSLHKVSGTSIDFFFVLEIQNISQNTFANVTIERLQKTDYRFKTRNYNGFKISEISDKGKVFTYIFYKNFFLASFTPYLVEDAIRVISDSELSSFKDKFIHFANDRSTKGLLSSYVNYEEMSSVINTFFYGETKLPILSGGYDMILDSSFIQFSGFSYDSGGWMSTHTSEPTTFDMAEIVPENTAYFYHITSTDIASWKKAQIKFIRESSPAVRKYQDSLKYSYDFHADQVLDLVDNEIGIATLESPLVRDNQKLIILEVKDIQESLNFFRQLEKRIAIARNDSVHSESYSDNEIRFLPISNFPSTFLGKMGDGFAQCFYINYRNYLIFSNDIQELKSLISSIINEDTWGKSIQMNDFMQRVNNIANVSLFVDVPRAWKSILDRLKPEWIDHFNENEALYKSINLAAFQYSYLDGKYFTNYTFTKSKPKPANIPKISGGNSVRFASDITSKPYLLKTHTYKNLDILLQDNSNTIHCVDINQKILWSKNIEGSIVSNIYPIDYYKNGKIQYTFATESSVYIIDRTGAYILGYPKSLPNNTEIVFLNLIDYNLSRNYRIAITDVSGNIYLTDKSFKILDGWSPKSLNRAALQPLHHARFARKDIMISLQENGVINVMNRRGEFKEGFPFDTKKPLSKNYFLRRSSSLNNSSLTLISEGGELIEITLEGNLIKREQLLKTSANANFQLIPDSGNNSFILVRREDDSYMILDDTGNVLFQKEYSSKMPILIQYYQFGAGKDLIVFTDTTNKSLYIYDKSGNLITSNPLNSANEINIIYSQDQKKLQVFTTWGHHLEFYTFDY